MCICIYLYVYVSIFSQNIFKFFLIPVVRDFNIVIGQETHLYILLVVQILPTSHCCPSIASTKTHPFPFLHVHISTLWPLSLTDHFPYHLLPEIFISLQTGLECFSLNDLQ